ncbi:ribosomal subunit interface protein [Candidatus Campbellbacteria bacterium CG10_big_fil_rev_8_21_14_0_10_35_52]|uniref:Ribosomal subunit interface protein n=1 Tax=Candidatus Campbellbacteria bacterium CG10_big_fil_rev_8_21_14_0_10_35_52 TaxID=1974527 RepID=A0A2M6WV65_9BACT|nr:MAG: ribosomal subunit interface protein [Candidatus Campbellbacteria bacterium CG10_big_fil_rev_8_21_14_0_10_35_52]
MDNIKKNVKATNIELTSEISDYLNKRLRSVEKLINPNDTSAIFDIEVGKITNHHQTGDIFRAEINLHIVGNQLRSFAEKNTIFNAIDKARDEMIYELLKTKGRQTRLLKKGGMAMKIFMRNIGARGARIRNFIRRRRK